MGAAVRFASPLGHGQTRADFSEEVDFETQNEDAEPVTWANQRDIGFGLYSFSLNAS